MKTIPYTMRPKVTRYNVAIFLFNYTSREDMLSLGEAFCADFDIQDLGIQRATDEQAMRMIVEDYLS